MNSNFNRGMDTWTIKWSSNEWKEGMDFIMEEWKDWNGGILSQNIITYLLFDTHPNETNN